MIGRQLIAFQNHLPKLTNRIVDVRALEQPATDRLQGTGQLLHVACGQGTERLLQIEAPLTGPLLRQKSIRVGLNLLLCLGEPLVRRPQTF